MAPSLFSFFGSQARNIRDVRQDKPGNDSGCTAVVAVVRGTTLYVANAGDSRCVVCRDGAAVEMSFDHKPEDEPEMRRIEAAGGKVTPDGRVNGGLNLSRAIGDHTYKTRKTLPLQDQMISPVPDIKTLQLDAKRDSFILLACDGIWNSMSSQETVNFVNQRLLKLENEHKKDPSTHQLTKICEELFDACLAPDTGGDGTGCDNMTAVLVKLRPAFQDKPDEPLPVIKPSADKDTAVTTGSSSSGTTASKDSAEASTDRTSEKASEDEKSDDQKSASNTPADQTSAKRPASSEPEAPAEEKGNDPKKLKMDTSAVEKTGDGVTSNGSNVVAS